MVGRSNTSAFNTAIASNIVSPRRLVDAEFTGGTVYLWDGIGDLSWNGNTYLGAGELLGIGEIVESVEVRIESMVIHFSGITAAYKSLALQSVDLKNQATVRLALLDSSGVVIADPDVLFIGNMDSVSLKEGGETARFDLVLQNELVKTQQPKERRYTDEDQKAIYPNDTFFRHSLNAEKETRWGSG